MIGAVEVRAGSRSGPLTIHSSRGRVAVKRTLPILFGVLCAWGCGDSASPPAAPVPPPPSAPAPSPPPDPHEPEPDGDIVVGFSQDRIELGKERPSR